MSARLKLKNAKKMMEAMHAHCEEQIFKAKVKEAECSRYIFNSKSISYIILGDESLPSYKATRVTIVFTNGRIKCFCFEDHESAERLYDKLFELV